MTLYSTLAECRSILKAEDTVDDSKVMSLLRIVSRRVDREFQSKRPLFLPYAETRRWVVTSKRVNSSVLNTFHFGDALLALTSVVLGTETLTIGTDVEAYSEVNQPPYYHLRLKNSTWRTWYDYVSSVDDGDPLYVTITGVWGLHRDYANALMSVDTLAANITSSAASLTVANVDGADLYGLTPRISAGNVLKLDDEYLEVTATDTATNAVTVRRGILGSTAAAHVATTAVKVWDVEEPIRRAVARQVGLMYARQGAYTTVVVDAAGGEVRYPADLLTELRATLLEYAYGA